MCLDRDHGPAGADTRREQWYANTIVGSDGPGTIEVRGQTLDQIAADLQIGRVGLLKMNIEGAEGPALQGMAGSLKRCDAAAVECHDFRADDPGDVAYGDDAFRTKSTVTDVLSRAGFEVRDRPDGSDNAIRDTVYAVRLPAEAQ